MTTAVPAGFACPHYAPILGGKRCRDYQDGGTCARGDAFLCIEWEKANRHRLPLAPATSAAPYL